MALQRRTVHLYAARHETAHSLVAWLTDGRDNDRPYSSGWLAVKENELGSALTCPAPFVSANAFGKAKEADSAR